MQGVFLEHFLFVCDNHDKTHFFSWSSNDLILLFFVPLLDCKTIHMFAYSGTWEQANKRSAGARLKVDSFFWACESCAPWPFESLTPQCQRILKSSILSKGLFKGRWILAEIFLRTKLWSRLSHKVYSVFPLLYYCISSLFSVEV